MNARLETVGGTRARQEFECNGCTACGSSLRGPDVVVRSALNRPSLGFCDMDCYSEFELDRDPSLRSGECCEGELEEILGA